MRWISPRRGSRRWGTCPSSSIRPKKPPRRTSCSSWPGLEVLQTPLPRAVGCGSCRRRPPPGRSGPLGSNWGDCWPANTRNWPPTVWISPTWPPAAGRGGFAEAARWQALHAIQDGVPEAAGRTGPVGYPDGTVGRRPAAGMPDRPGHLPGRGRGHQQVTLRQMLDQVAERVTALVFAPPEWADRFDEHGCLLPDVWETAPLPVRTAAGPRRGRPGRAGRHGRAVPGRLRRAVPTRRDHHRPDR